LVANLDGEILSQLTIARLVVSNKRDCPLEFVIDDSAPSTAPVSLFYNYATVYI